MIGATLFLIFAVLMLAGVPIGVALGIGGIVAIALANHVGLLLQTGEQRAIFTILYVVPADLRHSQLLRLRLEAHDLSVEPAQTRLLAAFQALARHQLHTDANSKNGPALNDDQFMQRFPETAAA